MNKQLNGRLQNKHDTEANWLKATNFIPMIGEIIVYDIDETHDYERMKVGDGINTVTNLPFVDAEIWSAFNVHTHDINSIEGLKEAVGSAADAKFYVVTFEATNGEYHADLTFAEIREKFEAGGNMVARIDGTDYIPLLSAAAHQIIFSGIYQSQSVSLTINSSDVCTLTTTRLSDSSHSHNAFSAATSSSNGKSGFVPAPTANDQDKYLCADGTWSDIILPGDETTSETIESMDIHVDTADTAYNAEKLGGVSAEEYALKSDLENIDVTSMVVLKRLNVTVPANGWVQQSTGRYTQTIQVSDLTSHSVCHHADVNMSGVTEETAADIKRAWSTIDSIEATDAGVVFTSFTEAPQVDLNVYIDIEEFIETVPNANGVIF